MIIYEFTVTCPIDTTYEELQEMVISVVEQEYVEQNWRSDYKVEQDWDMLRFTEEGAKHHFSVIGEFNE